MKFRRLLASLLLLAVPLCVACTHTNTDGTTVTGFTGFAENLGGLIGGGATTPTERDVVGGGGQAATVVLNLAHAYQVTDKCDAACSATIAGLSGKIRAELDKALDAEKAGNSFAVQGFLDAVNALVPQLRSFLNNRGVETPQ